MANWAIQPRSPTGVFFTSTFPRAFRIAFNVALGLRVFVTRFLAIGAELRDYRSATVEHLLTRLDANAVQR